MTNEIYYSGYTITLEPDEMPDDPLGWDDTISLVTWHPRYQFGPKHDYKARQYQSLLKDSQYISLPLYIYDHSGIALRASFSNVQLHKQGKKLQPYHDPFVGNTPHAGWDSGLLGLIRVSKKKLLESIPDRTRFTDSLMGEVYQRINWFLESYNQYINGDVWCLDITDREGDPVDDIGGCGFFGYSDTIDFAKKEIDGLISYE